MNSVASLIASLGGNAAVGRMIGKASSTVSEMKRRGSVPVEYWPAIRAEALRMGLSVSYDDLVGMHMKSAPQELTPSGGETSLPPAPSASDLPCPEAEGTVSP